MPTITIDFTDAWLNFRFSELLDTVKLSERLLKEEAADFEARVDAMAAEMSEELREGFYEFMSDEYWQIHERFPNILRRALFLYCYAEIEAYLNKICHIAQKQYNLDLPLNKVMGKGIERAKLYLTKVAGVTFPYDSCEWRELTNYNKLRNVLAHAEGRLSHAERERHLRDYVDRHPHLKLEFDGSIIIQEGFCEEVVEAALTLFKRLPKEVRR